VPQKMSNEPPAKRAYLLTKANILQTKSARRGWLKNGNPPGDPQTAARCGAWTRRRTACQAPAMRNGRCRMHGGMSTGPKTAEGLARSRRANWKHGRYSAEEKAERREVRHAFWILRFTGVLQRPRGWKPYR
jgi:hypothetical protein